MVIAILFNSDHPSLGSYYGWSIKQHIFNSKILQASGIHLKIGCGDLLFYSHAKTTNDIKQFAQKTLFDTKSEWISKDKICSCILNSTIFTWVVQNATLDLTEKLHNYLISFPSYLGIHEINFAYPYHLVFFRNYIGEQYRIIGNSIRIFCFMGEFEEYDIAEFDELKKLGFDDVDLEDSGARLTIFDDYDSPEHFQQIDDFITQTSSYFKNGENDAFELCMLLSDVNPKLFNSLGAAVRATKHIQNEEDVAHIALSGRRYLEQLADVLFEPSDGKFNGRNVRKADYKNRIWSFIETSIQQNDEDKSNIIKLGKEIDRLVDLFNSAIHGIPNQAEIINGFADLAKISLVLITLQPMYAKDPYFAYEKRLLDFIDECLNDYSKKA